MAFRNHRHDRRSCGRCGKLVGYRIDGRPMAHQCPHRVDCVHPQNRGGYGFQVSPGMIACRECLEFRRLEQAGQAYSIGNVLHCAVCLSKLDIDPSGAVRCDVCNTSSIDVSNPRRFVL